jgi:hypothetical protein
MSKVGANESPDGADNIGLSPVANTATAPSTKRGEHRKDERTDFEVGLKRGSVEVLSLSTLASALRLSLSDYLPSLWKMHMYKLSLHCAWAHIRVCVLHAAPLLSL